MYSGVFQGSVSLAIVADALEILRRPTMLPVPLEKVVPLVLILNEYFDSDGNRCYFH